MPAIQPPQQGQQSGQDAPSQVIRVTIKRCSGLMKILGEFIKIVGVRLVIRRTGDTLTRFQEVPASSR